ncbi:testis development-related protein isoform X1 [Pteropus medius]|uniref:testis development-related protein isoform X1 n=1 Tax=Pteropus vampyrus TaxID=132908 RepID=UPI00196A8409|nr:testis development-related protein isoform X1 [Pteropus giganteus]
MGTGAPPPRSRGLAGRTRPRPAAGGEGRPGVTGAPGREGPGAGSGSGPASGASSVRGRARSQAQEPRPERGARTPDAGRRTPDAGRRTPRPPRSMWKLSRGRVLLDEPPEEEDGLRRGPPPAAAQLCRGIADVQHREGHGELTSPTWTPEAQLTPPSETHGEKTFPCAWNSRVSAFAQGWCGRRMATSAQASSCA